MQETKSYRVSYRVACKDNSVHETFMVVDAFDGASAADAVRRKAREIWTTAVTVAVGEPLMIRRYWRERETRASGQSPTVPVWLVVAEHNEVPGIQYSAHWSEADANGARDRMVAQYQHALEYCDVVPTTIAGRSDLGDTMQKAREAAERFWLEMDRLEAVMTEPQS